MREEYLLSWRNRSESFRLPVNPLNTPTLSTGHNNHNFDSLAMGTFKAIGRRGLSHITIESFFPARYAPYCVCSRYDWREPRAYVEMINRWKESNEPIRLIITGHLNMAFAIERFDYELERGTGHISYTLELEEYRFANVPARANEEPVRRETGLRERPREEAKPEPEVITVEVKSQRDTLWSLAQRYLGDGTRWREIAEANSIAVPEAMVLGMKIRIVTKKGAG